MMLICFITVFRKETVFSLQSLVKMLHKIYFGFRYPSKTDTKILEAKCTFCLVKVQQFYYLRHAQRRRRDLI
jgi:hypothetical protein